MARMSKENEGLNKKYIAPEVLKGIEEDKVMTASDFEAKAADVYSLGIVFKDIKKHISNIFNRKQLDR